jgi:hypothetical protein
LPINQLTISEHCCRRTGRRATIKPPLLEPEHATVLGRC